MSRITDLYVKNQRRSRPNIDTSHRCIFKCPQCIRQKTTSQTQIRRSFDLEPEQFKKILDYYDYGITFCGQISDPIYHKDFLSLLKICDCKKKAVRIATVGSGKPDKWWDEAYSYGVGENAWYFGVDGIDKKSELYRIGSNFDDVWKRMKQGRDLGHCIVWQYIVFGYNEHELERAIEIAKEEDFALLVVNTNRGFRTDNPLLRDNVDFKLGAPDAKHREARVKKEYWAHRTKQLESWHNIPRRRWLEENPPPPPEQTVLQQQENRAPWKVMSDEDFDFGLRIAPDGKTDQGVEKISWQQPINENPLKGSLKDE